MVKAAVSAAKSASLIRERAADRFSEMFDWLRMVDWKRFCTAPKSARAELTCFIAASICVMADCEPAYEATLKPVMPVVAVAAVVPAAKPEVVTAGAAPAIGDGGFRVEPLPVRRGQAAWPS